MSQNARANCICILDTMTGSMSLYGATSRIDEVPRVIIEEIGPYIRHPASCVWQYKKGSGEVLSPHQSVRML